MRKSHNFSIGFALAVLLFIAAPTAHAQYPGYVTNSNDTGLPSYGSFISSSVDTVNLGTGGVSIRIPIASNTGRGSSYTFFLQYESKFWSLIPTVYPSVGNGPFVYYSWSPDQSAMWQTKDTHSVGYIGWTETTYTCAEPPQGGDAGAEIVYEYGPATVLIRSNYVYVAPDGSKHQLPLRNNYPMNFPGYCPDLTAGELPTNLVAQTDNDQVKVDITNDQVNDHSGIVVTLANGTHSSMAGEVDSNGNICCIAGRPTVTGDPATTLYHQVYDVVDSNGVTQKVIVDSVNITVSTAFPTTYYDPSHFVSQYSGYLATVVSKITLANGLAYTFSYDPTFGEISQINLPTGGYVKYQWTTLPQADLGPNDPISAVAYQPAIDARRISQRIVSEDGTAGSEKVWNYTYPSLNGYYTQGTTVTDPLGNSENHGFATCGVAGFTDPTPQPSVDLGVSYYDPSGKLLKTVINNWACDKGALYVAYPTKNLPFTYSVLTEGIRNSRQTGTVTTLADTNQVSATQSDFNDCYGYTVLTQSYTDCRPNPTETREYDYGTGAPGTLLRTTDFTYLHNPNLNNASNNYLNAHIWDRVLTKSVYAGSSSSGTLAAQTQYGYDSTAITSVTGASNHDDTDYPYTNTLRGNVTTVGRLLTSTSTWLTTTNYYNSVGNLVQTTDPGNHSYYLSYADNYSDSSKNGLSQAFLTSVTSPTTSNGIPHVEGKQYYWYSGLTAAVCGQNAPSPSTCSNLQGLPASDYASYTYDLMGRPAKVTHGDGGVTNFTFQESSFPFSVSSSSAIDSSQNLVNTALIDGLGRVTQTQLNSDPEGVDKVDTTYDPAGQKSTVSNPYRSPGDPTYGITTYQYDALGRTSLVIPPDGTTTSNNVSTTYSGNTVTVTDQAGKQRRSVSDALGRLIEVDEPSAPAGATVSNGYATISGTERWGGGASAVGWVTISGQEEGYTPTPVCITQDCGGNCLQWSNSGTVYDNGSVSISVNGDTKIVSYGIASTPYNIAWALMEAINADSSYPVTAGFNGNTNTVTLLAKAHGNNYSLYATSQTFDTSGNIWTPSFGASASGTALTGGVADWADTGTVTLTVGGVVNSVTYNASSTNTSIASALAAAVNANSSSLVTASVSGGTINFTDKTQGTALGLGVNIVSNYPTVFSPSSFLYAVSDEYLNNFATAPPASLLTPMVTLYTYNALDDLTCVEQHGTVTGQTGCSSSPSNDSSSAWRIRRFQYDSLGRLTSATNPESGAISYTYDADGNVLTKYDARGITTTMTYDQLHRVTGKSYSDGVTPAMYYTYDMPPAWGLSNAANLVGRLVEARNQCAGSNGCGTSTVNSYDSRGRVAWQWQQAPALAPGGDTVTYSYNFAGNVTSENTWPGITFNSQIDPAGRVIQFTSSYVDATHPATLATMNSFTPAGAISQMTYGNGLVETSAYNNRLQPTQLRTHNPTTNTDVLNLSYDFTDSAGANNGNVVSFISSATQVFMRSYTYDELNRLSTMSSPTDASGCYGLTWNYDAWGNRLSQNNGGGSCLTPSHAVSAVNRIIDTGYVHDAAGNMTSDNVHSYTYDAENRVVAVDGGATATYTYDANGRRVRKIAGGATTEYLYDTSGNVVADVNGSNVLQAAYSYLGGSLFAEYAYNLTLFIHKDHLGSTRVMTAMNGTVSDSMDYLPYGEQISGGSTSTHKFTGKERDAESGLDLMGARYFGSSLGRFMTSDPLYLEMGRLENPQALNLYAYVLNNPLNLSDPTGLDVKLQCQSDDKKCSGKTLKNLTNNLNARKNAGFKVKLGKDGLLAVQGKVDASKLNKSEEALYHAITDKDNHATLNVVSQSPTVNFDKFDGHGQNTVDASDMGMLAKADQSVAGEVLAHGMMEAYTSAATGNNLYSSTDSAGHIHVSLGIGVHQYASNFFPGGEPATPTANGNGTFGADVKVPALGITIGVTWAGKPPSNMTGVTVTKENQ